MRRYIANDRRIANEVTAANIDAAERATYVVEDTTPTSPTDLEVRCEAGTVVVDGTTVAVSAQTESVSDISGQVTETAYRYHTLSVDATGALVVRSSPVGEFDANDPDAEPITQVTEPSHETGEVFLGTAFQVGAAVERVFDGRYVLDGVPNSVITQGEGSGLDADTLRGGGDAYYLSRTNHTGTQDPSTIDPQGEGSGLDADTVRGGTPVETVNGDVGDVTFPSIAETASTQSFNESGSTDNTTGTFLSASVPIGISNALDLDASVSNVDQIDAGSLFMAAQLIGPQGNILFEDIYYEDFTSTNGSGSTDLNEGIASPYSGVGEVRIYADGSNYGADGSLSGEIVARQLE